MNELEQKTEIKKSLRGLEKQFAAEDSFEFEERLAIARQKAGDNKDLQEIIDCFEVLIPLGIHPTYCGQLVAALFYRRSHLPSFTP